ncbi:hypothetical protein FPV16_09820 [Methylobacterium sp. W2]|uniref:hypothetical protein n=1 Tax=Methylobacterium sp. W2 TaxID=2598107 RepID=UPI001D0C3882|nr:hypothetical protein [Methylobacterium sp. W2]MCC0806512.1 hypothetical protein [Methylobacterium sp. W2]
MIKAILLKPLDGDPVGSEREFDKLDFERLEGMRAVRAAAGASAKAAPPVLNKAAPLAANKAAPALATKAADKA